jgi:hypothetical protein
LSEVGLRRPEWIALGVVALGFALRAHGFTEPWLNPDEGIYYQLVHARDWDRLIAGIANNAHPPLQYLLLRGVAVFGDEFSLLRAPSLLFGTLAIWAMFRFGSEAAGWRSGLIAAALLALSPGSILMSQVMRPYALLLLLLVTSGWLCLRTLRTGAGRDLALQTAALGLAMLTHYAAFAAAPAFGIALLGDALAARRTRRLLAQRGAAQAALVALALGCYWLHLRPNLLGGSLQLEAQRGWLNLFFPDGGLDSWLGLIGVQRYLLGRQFEALAAVGFVLGSGVLLWHRRWAAAVLLLGVGGGAITLAWQGQLPLGSTRHSSYLAAFVLPALAAPLGFAWERGWRHGLAATAVAVAAVVWPSGLRALTGAEQLGTRNTIERVASAQSIREGLLQIERLTHEPRLIVMDRQTFAFLAPVLHELSDPARHGGGAVLAGFRWGRADVVVSQAWTLRVDARSPMARGHLGHLLARADEALPRLGIAERREGALVVGGWHVRRYQALLETDRARAAGEEGAVLEWQLGPGLAYAVIDWQRYRELLAHR